MRSGDNCYGNCSLGQKTIGLACVDCGTGFYGVGAGVCASCPPQSTTLTPTAVSVAECVCVPGRALINGSCLVVCGLGQYVSGDNCLTCPTGTYSDSTSTAVSCTDCPVAGMTTAAAGSTNVSHCICPNDMVVESVTLEGSSTAVSMCVAHCEAGLARPELDYCEVSVYILFLFIVVCCAVFWCYLSRTRHALSQRYKHPVRDCNQSFRHVERERTHRAPTSSTAMSVHSTRPRPRGQRTLTSASAGRGSTTRSVRSACRVDSVRVAPSVLAVQLRQWPVRATTRAVRARSVSAPRQKPARAATTVKTATLVFVAALVPQVGGLASV